MNSLSDTAKLILGKFSEYGLKENYSFSIFELLSKKSRWERHHQDNFAKAINELIDRGLIEWGETYVLILTEEGYRVLSHPDHP